MKLNIPFTLFFVIALAPLITAQGRRTAPETLISRGQYEIRERGPHHNKVGREIVVRDQSGEIVTREQSYVELATGMNFLDEGEWKPADPTIELFEGGAIARNLQQKIIFSPNILDEDGTIDFQTPDGQRLRAAPLALAYFDPVTGQDAIIAVAKDSVGEVHGESRVVYPDAFDGVEADVIYDLRISGFSQDVILREQIPPAEDFGLNSEFARLEILTEFLEAPRPQKEERILWRVEDPVLRGIMATPDFVDEELVFGQTRFGPGRAFSNNQAGLDSPVDEAATPVGKRWVEEDGRMILFESVDFQSILPMLDQLPARQQARIDFNEIDRPELLASSSPDRTVPRRPDLSESEFRGIQIADISRHRPGVILDYTTIDATQTDYTFKGDTTYYIKGSIHLYGTTTLEGGTVIKFDKYNSGSSYYTRLYVNDGFVCNTDFYRPAIVTARDDDTVGEILSESDGTVDAPGHYGYYGFHFNTPTSDISLHHVHFRNTLVACLFYKASTNTHSLKHVTFTQCRYGIYANDTDVEVGNILIDDAYTTAFWGRDTATIDAEHVTVHDAAQIFYDQDANSTLNLTNSLLVDVTTTTHTGSETNVEIIASAAGLFQSVGVGDFYLAPGSPYRDAGTTSIDATLASELRTLTTYPPVELEGDITEDTTLYPHVERDMGIPDLGYHYTPIDYALFVVVKDSTLTINPGTVIVPHNYGSIELQDGSHLEAVGTVSQPIQFARYYASQEQPAEWVNHGYPERSIISRNDGSNTPTANIRFANFNGISGGGYTFYLDNSWWKIQTLDLVDCQIYGNESPFSGGQSPYSNITIKNCLFVRALAKFTHWGVRDVYNNLFSGGTTHVERWSAGAGTWTFKDNSFHSTALTDVYGGTSNSYNGYLGASQGTLSSSSGNDETATTFTYDSGQLGRFYQNSTDLLDEGSQAAGAAGLFHFTTESDNSKDTGTVDIGYHYVAVDSTSGEPDDTDGDGIPDYLEDADGDGNHDSGTETDWEESENGTTGTTGLLVFTILE